MIVRIKLSLYTNLKHSHTIVLFLKIQSIIKAVPDRLFSAYSSRILSCLVMLLCYFICTFYIDG